MPPLFPDFLDNSDSYEAAVAFWDQLVSDVERSLGQKDQWARWIPMHFGDGTPMDKDGNPIFDGYSQALGRAFRIIQHPPVSERVEVTAWIKTYDLGGEPTPLPDSELVLGLSLSDESARIAEGLLRTWMKPEMTPSAMEAVMDAVLPGDADSEP